MKSTPEEIRVQLDMWSRFAGFKGAGIPFLNHARRYGRPAVWGARR